MANRKSVEERLGNRRSSVQPADLYSTPEISEAKATPTPKVETKKPVIADEREPFSSSLRPSRKRKLKLYSIGMSKKDNEILEQALDEFFEKYKDEAQL